MPAPSETPLVTQSTRGSSNAFEIFAEPSATEAAGYATYVDYEKDGVKQRIFPHTVVNSEFRGQGLASQLIRHALDDSIAAGFRIVPTCSYVGGWVRKHPEYLEHVDEPKLQHAEALGDL